MTTKPKIMTLWFSFRYITTSRNSETPGFSDPSRRILFSKQNSSSRLYFEKMFFSKKCTRNWTFSEYLEHTSPISKSFKTPKLRQITKFSILKLIYFCLNSNTSQKHFAQNELVKWYSTRAGKLLFIEV